MNIDSQKFEISIGSPLWHFGENQGKWGVLDVWFYMNHRVPPLHFGSSHRVPPLQFVKFENHGIPCFCDEHFFMKFEFRDSPRPNLRGCGGKWKDTSEPRERCVEKSWHFDSYFLAPEGSFSIFFASYQAQNTFFHEKVKILIFLKKK